MVRKERWAMAAVVLLLALAMLVARSERAFASGTGLREPGRPAWPAQGPSPLPTPEVPEAVQQLERQAQQQLDQLSAQAKSKVDAETKQLEEQARQQAARQAGNVIRDLMGRLQQILLNLVAQVCGASSAAVLLPALVLLAVRAGRRR